MRELIDREAALDAIKFAELGCEYDEVEKVQIFNPWHRVEDELPSEFQSVWAACKMNGVENWTIETVYDPYLSCPWGYNIPELESGKAVVYAWMDRSAPEPPKEEA